MGGEATDDRARADLSGENASEADRQAWKERCFPHFRGLREQGATA